MKNAGVDQAMNWALEHGEDPDINDPIAAPAPAAAPAAAGPKVDEEAVKQVAAILEGFPLERIRHALVKTVHSHTSLLLAARCPQAQTLTLPACTCVQNGDVGRAVDYAMSHMDDPLPTEESECLLAQTVP